MIGTILVIFVAIEAIGIMILEMFGSSGQQAKAFELEEAFVKLPGVKTLLANQGIYNGLFGALIIGTVLLLTGSQQLVMLRLEMLFVLVAAVYGSLTAARKIIIMQGLPAVLALLLLFS